MKIAKYLLAGLLVLGSTGAAYAECIPGRATIVQNKVQQQLVTPKAYPGPGETATVKVRSAADLLFGDATLYVVRSCENGQEVMEKHELNIYGVYRQTNEVKIKNLKQSCTCGVSLN